MTWVRSEARNGLRGYVIAFAAFVAVAFITSDAADARHHRRLRVHYVHHTGYVHHHAHAEGYAPPSSSIVVDGNTDQVLQASNPDALRHPASLTKIMTLYLLFERLDAGKIKLDTPLKVSEHAAGQDPTKLDLKPGQTIAVEDAIKGVVTRSANDAAVVIAENLGGSEDDFAKLMTQKAHALGMSHTTYVNASGLPDDDQITTARDQALLGRAIQDRFPRYYKYFSTPTFVYHGVAIRNHDHLLSMDGVDGIKTGFTRASGFNLVTSVHRDGRYVVAVVLGGRSAFERDAHMRELINEHIKEAALHRAAPVVAEQAPQHDEPQPVAFAKAPMSTRADPAPAATVIAHAAAGATDPIQPLLVRTVSYRIAPVQAAPLGPMPALIPVPAPLPQPAVSQAAAAAPEQPDVPESAVPSTVVASAEPIATPVPSQPEPAKSDSTKLEVAKPVAAKLEPAVPEPAQLHVRGGWLIQIGAFDGEDEAKQHLSAAQIKAHDMLAAADPFTERVQKGDKALFRARFAGFDKTTAEAACKQLKHNDFECMTLKN
jgi:D-alanyl-D-alanine carboxypeptidase